MFFANCNYACPILLNDMRRIEAALPEGLCTNVSFTLISFDTKRDTPKALALFRQAQGLAADHWNLLSGSDDDILELAALLGVRYKQDATGQFMHSNLITILNAKGEVVHQQIGLNQDVAETVRTLKQLMTP
jgi:protein SCO1/2